MINTFRLRCRNAFRQYIQRELFRVIVIGILIGICLIGATSLIVTSHYNSQFKVIYSLDKRQNDQEIIRLIKDADEYVYFAIYFFTKDNIADALISAKKRGLIVEGITDAGASRDSNKNIIDKLKSAGIRVETQKHTDGIMHLKVLVTDKAYASGSYNWTAGATNINDEVLEVSTNNSLRKKYLAIIKKLLSINDSNYKISGNESNESSNVSKDDKTNIGVDNLSDKIPEYDYTEAPDHIGERAVVKGTVVKVFTAKSGVTFLDFCEDFYDCPFSAVIFASDLKKFQDVSKFQREVLITGTIKSYQGKAEIIINNPEQIK